MDIVASSIHGTFDSDILHHVVNLQRDFKAFFHFIRKWINDLTDVRLKKMILLYLVIFYMQNINVLPSLRNVHSNLRKEIVQGVYLPF